MDRPRAIYERLVVPLGFVIGQPTGWQRQVSGNRIVLLQTGGAERGAIRYDERKFPLASATDILDQQLAGDRFRVVRIGPWERMITLEGEHAAAVTVHGTLEGEPAQRDVGIVFLDDTYALTTGFCLAAEDFVLFTTTVRDLVRGDSHFLGVRRRRFEYTPPVNWQARSRGFKAEWFPRDYPADRAVITVWPAMPGRVVSASELVAQMTIGVLAKSASREAFSVGDLHGELLRIDDGPARRRIIVLEDERYTYAVRLEGVTTAAHEAAFLGLARSLRPIPHPVSDPDALGAWVD